MIRSYTTLPPPPPSDDPWLRFLETRLGTRNWVVFARRTRRIVERYGDDVVVVTPRRWRELESEFNRGNDA